jgi:hypothetical protein
MKSTGQTDRRTRQKKGRKEIIGMHAAFSEFIKRQIENSIQENACN